MYRYEDNSTAYDPMMVNLKGVKVQVPLKRVEELISQGYRLVNPNFDYKKVMYRLGKGMVPKLESVGSSVSKLDLILV